MVRSVCVVRGLNFKGGLLPGNAVPWKGRVVIDMEGLEKHVASILYTKHNDPECVCV